MTSRNLLKRPVSMLDFVDVLGGLREEQFAHQKVATFFHVSEELVEKVITKLVDLEMLVQFQLVLCPALEETVNFRKNAEQRCLKLEH